MSIPAVDLTELHAKIKTALAEHFAGVDVDYYDRPGEKLPTPSIRFALDGIGRGDPDDSGTEQTNVVLKFSAEAATSYKAGKKLAVRLLAAALVKFVSGQRFESPVGPGKVVSGDPFEFSDEYESWKVEWTHEAALGENIWEEVGPEVTEVNIGAAPKVGEGFDPDYTQP